MQYNVNAITKRDILTLLRLTRFVKHVNYAINVTYKEQCLAERGALV